MMTSAQVVETSVTITDKSPSQDYTHPDDQTTLLNKQMIQNGKTRKYRNIHILYKLTAIVDVCLADCTTTFHTNMVERECLTYRITIVSLTKHVQRNICHLSNPIKVGWFAREGHPLHSLCDWTCYNWMIANNSGLISVDFVFGGRVGFRSTGDTEGLVHNDRIVAGVSLQQCVIRTMV